MDHVIFVRHGRIVLRSILSCVEVKRHGSGCAAFHASPNIIGTARKGKLMAKLMDFEQLIKITAAAGITLDEVPIEDANLYVLVDPGGEDIYVGKSASKRRHNEEEQWKKNLDYEQEIVSGFVALAAENNTQRRPLRYDPEKFDPSKLKMHIAAERWSGAAIDTVVERLDEKIPPTPEEVEQILIRIHIRTGRLIGNSQYASQWETPIGAFTDTVAVLAADAARISGVLPRRTTVATEGVDAAEGVGSRATDKV
jgi:hypothetical protein